MKLLKGKRGINFHDLGFCNVFLDGYQKQKQQEKKIDTLHLVKMKTFCAQKDITERLKR